MELLLNDKGDGGEFELEGGDLKQDNTFYTSVYLSLFGGDSFFNIFLEYPTDKTFEESISLPLTTPNLKKVETAAQNALKWMLDQGVAQSVDVYAFGGKDERINVEITITEPDGNTCQYSITWQNEKTVLKRG